MYPARVISIFLSVRPHIQVAPPSLLFVHPSSTFRTTCYTSSSHRGYQTFQEAHSHTSVAMNQQTNGIINEETKIDRIPAKLILCFDGTGNKYSGDPSDTNVVKLYQKFNREAPNQYHYYQRECQLVAVS